MSPKNPFLPTFGTSPPLLAGRDGEVARFARAFEDGPGHPDYTLLITGPRGSGKTVLLNEAEDAALALGWRAISMSASVADLTRRITAAALVHLHEINDGKPASASACGTPAPPLGHWGGRPPQQTSGKPWPSAWGKKALTRRPAQLCNLRAFARQAPRCSAPWMRSILMVLQSLPTPCTSCRWQGRSLPT